VEINISHVSMRAWYCIFRDVTSPLGNGLLFVFHDDSLIIDQVEKYKLCASLDPDSPPDAMAETEP
jgi:hypothetical protein